MPLITNSGVQNQGVCTLYSAGSGHPVLYVRRFSDGMWSDSNNVILL